MNEKSTMEQYADYLNENIFPFIDYEKLRVSYKTDMVYAKGILNLLHEAMVKVYGGEMLDKNDGDDGFLIIPGVLRGRKSGEICLALLNLDLSSSGEHWGTNYICRHGVISQNDEQQPRLSKMMNALYVPYDYGYTAVIPCDYHVDEATLPKELKVVLNDFLNHKVDFSKTNNIPDKIGSDKKTSVLEGIHEAEKEIKEKGNGKSDVKKKETER